MTDPPRPIRAIGVATALLALGWTVVALTWFAAVGRGTSGHVLHDLDAGGWWVVSRRLFGYGAAFALAALAWTRGRSGALRRPIVAAGAVLGGFAIATALEHGVGVLGDVGWLALVLAGVSVWIGMHVAAGVVGLHAARPTGRNWSPTLRAVIGGLGALGLSATAVFVGGLIGLPPIATGVVGTVLAAMLGRRVLHTAGRWAVDVVHAPATPGAAWPALAVGGLCTLLLHAVLLADVRVASPPWHFDAMHVHLAAPRAYNLAGSIQFLPQLRGSYLLPLLQCQFAPLLGIFGELGPKGLELAYTLAVLVLTWETARAVLPRAHRPLAVLAPVLVAATPLVQYLTGICYLGLPATAYGLAAVWTARGLDHGAAPTARVARQGALVGLFLGFVFLAKIQAWAFAVPTIAIALRGLGRRPHSDRAARISRAVAGATLAGLGVVLAPCLRNIWFLGNPVYPVGASLTGIRELVGSAADLESMHRSIRATGMGHGLWDLLALGPRLVLHPESFRGGGPLAFGPGWLALAPLAVLGLRRRSGWWMALGVSTIGVPWFVMAQELRYLVHAIPWVAVLVTSGVARGWGRWPAAIGGLTTAIALLGTLLQAPASRPRTPTLALRGAARTDFLRVRVIGFQALRELNWQASDDTGVFAVGLEGAKYWYRNPARLYGDHYGAWRYSAVFETGATWRFRDTATVVDRLRAFDVQWVAVAIGRVPLPPDELILRARPDLRRHLRLETLLDGVLLYRFDPAGGFDPTAVPVGRDDHLRAAQSDTPWNGWTLEGGATAAGGTLRLPPGAQAFRLLPATAMADDRYAVYHVVAQAEGTAGALRLQAAWLAPGGWAATDATGCALTTVDALRATVRPDATTRVELLCARTEVAAQVALYVVNDGDAVLTVQPAQLQGLGGPR